MPLLRPAWTIVTGSRLRAPWPIAGSHGPDGRRQQHDVFNTARPCGLGKSLCTMGIGVQEHLAHTVERGRERGRLGKIQGNRLDLGGQPDPFGVPACGPYRLARRQRVARSPPHGRFRHCRRNRVLRMGGRGADNSSVLVMGPGKVRPRIVPCSAQLLTERVSWMCTASKNGPRPASPLVRGRSRACGGCWVRTNVVVRRQIYSLLPLATRATRLANRRTSRSFRRMRG